MFYHFIGNNFERTPFGETELDNIVTIDTTIPVKLYSYQGQYIKKFFAGRVEFSGDHSIQDSVIRLTNYFKKN